ncbi:MAG: RluA family pseudouridine synthase, partial [Alphaproteobacteria bacterium]|nr:RluA family pseudouridine synthase [Alphaproteobacteria bacterium]
MTNEYDIPEDDDLLAEDASLEGASPEGASGVESVEVGEFEGGIRLDKFLAQRLPDLSRTRVQALIEEGSVTLDGKPVTTLSKKVQVGETYSVQVPPPVDSTIPAVAMELDIVYEDDDLLVINKAAGMTVHPAPGHYDDTLVNGLLHHCKGSLSGIGGVARPGIVHRIDKDTSGLLVVAKNDYAHASLARQLKARTLKRVYLAVCWGLIPYGEGSIEADIGRNPRDRKKMAVVKTGGKPATT